MYKRSEKVAVASQCTYLLLWLRFWLGLLSFKQQQRLFLDGVMNWYSSIFDELSLQNVCTDFGSPSCQSSMHLQPLMMRNLQLQCSQALPRLLETDFLMLPSRLPVLEPASGMSSVQKCPFSWCFNDFSALGLLTASYWAWNSPRKRTPDQRPSIFEMPFTMALFCSWSWSVGIMENGYLIVT